MTPPRGVVSCPCSTWAVRTKVRTAVFVQTAHVFLHGLSFLSGMDASENPAILASG